MANALARSETPGVALGRYRPLRPLGSGGSGSVWLARDERTGLDVALKIVPVEGKAGPRAEREAEASARLRHPRCLRAYAFGRERGHVYIAYEYAPGRTLRDAIRGRELSDARAIEASAQLLEGLAHAHGRGILHRDVKPANVLLVDGPDTSVRLLDFGLAAFAEAETLTAQGDVPGTLAYIAPERLAGGPASAAADVWSVGVILWEALAGRHPFASRSLLETGRAIEAGAPPLRTVRPDLPAAILGAVDAALAPDPRRRPSAARLADALRDAPRRRPRRLGPQAGRLAPAAAAGIYAGGAAILLPFWPVGFAPALAALTAAIALLRPRLGAVVALAVPVFPLGNLALGLALAYALVAPLWLALFATPLRRALAAATAAALLDGVAQPPQVALAGEPSPLVAAQTVVAAVPLEAWRLALALGLAAAVLPLARTPWRLALWGGALLAAVLLPNPSLAAAPVVALVWGACAVLVLRSET